MINSNIKHIINTPYLFHTLNFLNFFGEGNQNILSVVLKYYNKKKKNCCYNFIKVKLAAI